MTAPARQASHEALGVAFAQAHDIIGDAVRSVGVGPIVHLSQTHPDLFAALDTCLRLLSTHENRVLT
jgi:hypothetical protein